MQDLLGALKQQGYDMHVVSNYPTWYQMIERKLQVPDRLPTSSQHVLQTLLFCCELLCHLDGFC